MAPQVSTRLAKTIVYAFTIHWSPIMAVPNSRAMDAVATLSAEASRRTRKNPKQIAYRPYWRSRAGAMAYVVMAFNVRAPRYHEERFFSNAPITKSDIMDIHDLTVFATAARLGSVTKAAQSL